MTLRVVLAEESGFCFGVKRAIELALKSVEYSGAVYSFGPIIHSPQETARLSQLGVIMSDSLQEIPPGSTLIIRSHGVPPQVVSAAKERGLAVVDATCPLVKRAQQRAQELAEAGYKVVVVGEAEHPEVQAILAHAPGAVVIEDGDSLESLGSARRIGVVAQTTQSREAFRAVIGRVLELEPAETRVYHTICNATLHRQEAALALARRVHVMVVVGGRNSANTRRLAELCAETDVPTHHIETAEEVEPAWFRDAELVGVTAGASTPDWVIEEVMEKLRSTG